MNILGLRPGHDASAALVVDGRIIADVAEERFTRIKNDSTFPVNAIRYCLEAGGISSEDLDVITVPSTQLPPEVVAFFNIPRAVKLPDFERKPGFFRRVEAQWKARLRDTDPGPWHPIPKGAPSLPLYHHRFPLSDKCTIVMVEHHLAHAASAAYTSGVSGQKALVATIDGIGDDVAVAFWRFERNRLTCLHRVGGEGSLAWFYGNATEALKWRHGSDEWKVMGLAPYGTPHPGALKGFYPEYKDGELIRPHDYDGFGNWNDHGAMHWQGQDAEPLSRIAANLGKEDFAAEVQRAVEEQAFNLIPAWLEKEKTPHLLCAGGFFLNVKLNQKLWYSDLLETQWVYPNPGDAGLSAGAALQVFFSAHPDATHERIPDVYWGPQYSDDEIEAILRHRGIQYTTVENPTEQTADYLARNLTIGWFQGRMEAGPRALGSRSILMSPLRAENKDRINAKIKYREPFRPFCPSMLREKAEDYFVRPREENFMTCSFDVKPEKQKAIPAVVHVDQTARPQMVRREVNPRYYELIDRFGHLTGEPVILNTSFNVKGEPIVANPREAIKCFYDTGLDVLVLGRHIVEKPMLDRASS